MKVHGGYGYSTEFEVERLYRDAILMSIGEGTNDILRTVVAKALVRGRGQRSDGCRARTCTCPATRPDKLAKAAGRGADALIVDLEDAVPLAMKDDARAAVVAWLRAAPPPLPVWVRVNPGAARDPDLNALAGLPGAGRRGARQGRRARRTSRRRPACSPRPATPPRR